VRLTASQEQGSAPPVKSKRSLPDDARETKATA